MILGTCRILQLLCILHLYCQEFGDGRDDLPASSKSPNVQAPTENVTVPVATSVPVAASLNDPLPPVMPQVPPSLEGGVPGLMTQPPLLQSPIAYQLPVVPPLQSVPPLHVLEKIVKEEPKGPRPIKSIPIAGTPWSVVWSSDNRRFFFNATNRASVWNTPEDLVTNPLVHKILEETTEGKSKNM